MRNNFEVDWNVSGRYATDVFTERAVSIINTHNTSGSPLFLHMAHLATHAPLQAPQEDIERFAYIKDEDRRIYAAMVSKLDKSVGELVQALATKDMLKNSVIFFYSDNGGPTLPNIETYNTASNYPFKGVSNNLFFCFYQE